ncbi:TATA-binding protein-associated factor 172-like, partial [Amphibalanus amphitrite]|uniref:TATA-binding protein-associated factor 172-like n=1 Tax=Amphibalanus amphitrite TaxID=1232801 RepID=UPI001C91D0C3
MTTRLERLFVLLENGSSSLTRKAAAQQLGDVLKLHPHELYSLLDRVHEYLQSSSWECRIAAGQAVEAIVSNLPQWRPTPASQLTDEVCVPSSSPSPPYLQLTLESFNLDQVLAENPILTSLETADATDDQGIQDDVTGPADVSTQRRLVNQRLGLDVAESLGVDTSGIFSDADLMCSTASQSADSGPAHQSEEQTSSRKVNQHRRRLREGADRQRPPGTGQWAHSSGPLCSCSENRPAFPPPASVCLSVGLPVCLSVSGMSLCLSLCLSISLCLSSSLCVSVPVSVSISG